MRLIILYGPPAVGKYTVGKRLARLTGYPLLHNHLVVDLVASFFPFGTGPFRRFSRELRQTVVRRACAEGVPGLIVTVVWWLGYRSDALLLKGLASIVRRYGGRVSYVELKCAEATLLRRVKNRARRRYGKLHSATKLKRLLREHQMNSKSPAERPPGTVLLDTDQLLPEAAARTLVRRLHLSGRR